ncbi:hypothetical protein GTB64_004447 [Salmonella enterica]|nr:hypothetical protein [Salmonella enterica]
MNIPNRRTDQVPEITAESKLASHAAEGKEWLIIHSYLTDPVNKRCCISPPMLAMRWDMAQVVFNSLLEDAVVSTGQKHGSAYLCKLNDEDDVFRVGIFKEYGENMLPEEVLMLMTREAMTDELYFGMYLKDGPGETVISDMVIHAPMKNKKTVLH